MLDYALVLIFWFAQRIFKKTRAVMAPASVQGVGEIGGPANPCVAVTGKPLRSDQSKSNDSSESSSNGGEVGADGF